MRSQDKMKAREMARGIETLARQIQRDLDYKRDPYATLADIDAAVDELRNHYLKVYGGYRHNS